jgi:hypothetical protein
MVAERVGFEPTVPIARDTRFPGAPVQPLQHLSYEKLRPYSKEPFYGLTHRAPCETPKLLCIAGMAERVGFEPTTPIPRSTAFRERRLQPLGHLSHLPL